MVVMTETPQGSNEIARVAKVLDEHRLVLNRGTEHGVELGTRYLIYEAGEEIDDPDSGDSLGALEIVKGEAVVDHVQARMSLVTLERGDQRQKTLSEMMATLSGGDDDEGQVSVSVGDYARKL